MTLQNDNFFFCGQLMKHQLIELFYLSNLLQMLNDCTGVNVEFFCNFSCSRKRISFNDPLNWSLSTPDGPSLRFLIFKALVSLSHHCTVHSSAVPKPSELLMLDVISAALQLILNSNKKITQICSKIISLV